MSPSTMTRRDNRMIARDKLGRSVAEPTVGAGFARGLLDLAVAKGADRAALIKASGIDAQVLEDQDRRIPFASYVTLMRAAKAMTGDGALGLHYGEMVDIARVSIIGLLGQASANMLEAFNQLNRYVRLIVETENGGSGERFQMLFDATGLWMVDNRTHADDFPELTESAFAQLICGPRRHDETPIAKAVHVTHAAPAHAVEYERIFQAPVTFGAARNAILVDPSRMEAPVARLPRYAFGVLSEHAERLLKDLEQSQTVRGRVERLLMPSLHTGEVSMEAVASQMAMTRQTLLRKLKGEGVTFAGVLDALRHRLATHYLTGQKVSVQETAYLVGFSDPAAFSRAFKRWTGASPGSLRESR